MQASVARLACCESKRNYVRASCSGFVLQGYGRQWEPFFHDHNARLLQAYLRLAGQGVRAWSCSRWQVQLVLFLQPERCANHRIAKNFRRGSAGELSPSISNHSGILTTRESPAILVQSMRSSFCLSLLAGLLLSSAGEV